MPTTIYKITNTLTGDVYVGSTTMRVERRWSNHKSDLRCKRHPNRGLQIDAIVLGLDVFEFEKLCTCQKYERSYIEAKYIEELGATYNVRMNPNVEEATMH